MKFLRKSSCLKGLFYVSFIILLYLQISYKKPESKYSESKYSIPSNLLKDILITIKTSAKNHQTRIKYIASTWYNFAKDQVSIMDD